MKKVKVGSAILASTFCLSLPILATPATASAVSVISHAPNHPMPALHGSGASGASTSNLGWASTNWSGYAITGTTYHDITGSWVVPAVSATRSSSYSSTWIGIDGYNNSDLIQTGTEQDYYSGQAHYNAWWEILPAAETPLSTTTYPVAPGDQMSATIHNNGNGTWNITISDNTKKWSFTTTQTYSGPGSSAEWIQEAPTVGGRVATLAHYGEVTIDPGTVNGGNPNLTAADGGYMENSRGTQIISTPSNPDGDTDGFNVAYGSTAPAAPAS